MEIHNNSFINSNPRFPSFIGDCPVLERSNTDINVIEDFVFPLSSNETFIFKKGTKKEINNILFYFNRDLAIIDSASIYVGCKNKEHLEKVIEMYNQMKNSNNLENINKYLFNFIE